MHLKLNILFILYSPKNIFPNISTLSYTLHISVLDHLISLSLLYIYYISTLHILCLSIYNINILSSLNILSLSSHTLALLHIYIMSLFYTRPLSLLFRSSKPYFTFYLSVLYAFFSL